jgi:hypothetical protein
MAGLARHDQCIGRLLCCDGRDSEVVLKHCIDCRAERLKEKAMGLLIHETPRSVFLALVASGHVWILGCHRHPSLVVRIRKALKHCVGHDLCDIFLKA